MADINAIIAEIDRYLERSGFEYTNPVDANKHLEKVGLLRDSKHRPGKPLRDLLRAGLLPHAYQPGGKGTIWIIPHSKRVR